VSVPASAQKETYKQKPVFETAVLSVAPESSITCGSFGECAEGNLHVEANIRDRLEVEVEVKVLAVVTLVFPESSLCEVLAAVLSVAPESSLCQ
jgi:hypothetical protein